MFILKIDLPSRASVSNVTSKVIHILAPWLFALQTRRNIPYLYPFWSKNKKLIAKTLSPPFHLLNLISTGSSMDRDSRPPRSSFIFIIFTLISKRQFIPCLFPLPQWTWKGIKVCSGKENILWWSTKGKKNTCIKLNFSPFCSQRFSLCQQTNTQEV